MFRRLLVIASALLAVGACVTPEQRGEKLFAEHGCAVCHGSDGRGDGPSAGRLDTAPRDFADPRAYSQGASPADIAVSIRRGAGAMPPFRDLTDDEARDIAAWIVSRQRRSGGSDSSR